jgi:hypothetical protein
MRAYREARKTLADDAIVGSPVRPSAISPWSRERAPTMSASTSRSRSRGDHRLVGEIMTVPVHCLRPMDPPMATALRRSGADFIGPEPDVWGPR